jgi:hypothetical protein
LKYPGRNAPPAEYEATYYAQRQRPETIDDGGALVTLHLGSYSPQFFLQLA